MIAMNGMYWKTLAGAQITLLLLVLALPDHVAAVLASKIVGVYAGISLVHSLANLLVERFVNLAD